MTSELLPIGSVMLIGNSKKKVIWIRKKCFCLTENRLLMYMH